jgi:hypothetical protein
MRRGFPPALASKALSNVVTSFIARLRPNLNRR